jgi:hypothetical protein
LARLSSRLTITRNTRPGRSVGVIGAVHLGFELLRIAREHHRCCDQANEQSAKQQREHLSHTAEAFAFFAEPDGHKAGAIAVRQLRALEAHQRGKLRLDDVKQMFMLMREHLEQ